MIENIDHLHTYINYSGEPILRRCRNCKFWQQVSEEEDTKAGYCKLKPLYFAYTMQPSVFTITKDFYLCERHRFKNEEILEIETKKVLMKDTLKKKE
jgi:hypothetical protein